MENNVINPLLNPLSIVEIKINEYKEFTKEIDNKLSSIDELINYYKMKKNMIENDIKNYEDKLNEEIRNLLNIEDFKETKTQLSYKLISGKFIIKKKDKKIVVIDEKSLLDFLEKEKSNEYIRTKKEVNWSEYKKNLHIDSFDNIVDQYGEIISSCKVETIPEKTSLVL